MRVIYKYKWISGSKRLYDYGYNHNRMITKEAKQRLKIIQFWRKYGLEAVTEAYGAKRSTLYGWWKIYQDSGGKLASLNPKSQAPHHRRKRIIDCRIVAEIRRLRTEVCPNMGKDKVKKELDIFCSLKGLKPISASTIGRIIKAKRIYHHRQKVSHFGKLKIASKRKKERKPKGFLVNAPGELIEVDTIVKFIGKVKRYIITAIDVHSRYAFAYGYTRASSNNAKDFFKKLTVVFPYAVKHVQTDNGSEFHKYFNDYLKQNKIIHFWNYPGQPYKNGHIEKYNRTIQEEFIDWNEMYLDEVERFNQKLMDWLLWYNTKRYHWSLDLTSPVDYLLKNSLVSEMCWTNTRG